MMGNHRDGVNKRWKVMEPLAFFLIENGLYFADIRLFIHGKNLTADGGVRIVEPIKN